MANIQLNASNKAFARYKTHQSSEWKDINAGKLTKGLRSDLNLFYTQLAGQEMEDDLVLIKVAYDRETSAYQRCYAPAIYSNVDGKLVIVWGNELYPVTSEIVESLEVEIEEVQLERYTEKCLTLNVDSDGGYLSLPLQLKISVDNKDVELKRLKKLLKDGKLDELAGLLYIKDPNKSSGGFKPTVKFTELPELTTINVLTARKVEFATHSNYVLEVTYDGLDEPIQCWCPNDLKMALEAGANIDESGATDFVFVQKTTKNNKVRSIVTVNNLIWDDEDEDLISL